MTQGIGEVAPKLAILQGIIRVQHLLRHAQMAVSILKRENTQSVNVVEGIRRSAVSRPLLREIRTIGLGLTGAILIWVKVERI